MYGTLDISTSALVTQRTRMDVYSGNIANASSVGYKRRVPIVAAGAGPNQLYKPGVHVAQIAVDNAPGLLVDNPSHPLAIQSGPNKGKVEMSNVSVMEDMINAMEAARAYDANITMISATRAMAESALRMIA